MYSLAGAEGAERKEPAPDKQVSRLALCRPQELAMAMKLATIEELKAARDYCAKNNLEPRRDRLELEIQERTK